MANRKKGFTLVELLIVIVVIGVLSAMMMLSSTEAVSSAKAANIINNLRNWKTATLEWYADHIDKVNDKGQVRNASDSDWTNISDATSCVRAIDVAKYVNGEFEECNMESKYTNSGGARDSSGVIYGLREINAGDGYFRWMIVCQLATDKDKSLLSKLESRASSLGLLDVNHKSYKAAGDNRHILHIEVMDFSK